MWSSLQSLLNFKRIKASAKLLFCGAFKILPPGVVIHFGSKRHINIFYRFGRSYADRWPLTWQGWGAGAVSGLHIPRHFAKWAPSTAGRQNGAVINSRALESKLGSNPFTKKQQVQNGVSFAKSHQDLIPNLTIVSASSRNGILKPSGVSWSTLGNLPVKTPDVLPQRKVPWAETILSFTLLLNFLMHPVSVYKSFPLLQLI